MNDILPAIAEKSASILNKPPPDLARSITKIMNAVIMDENTSWNKERKIAQINLKLQNFTSRARSYTILAQWPEGFAEMVDNERGGRKEARGLWGWKMETLEPGESATVEFGLAGLEKGDWKETEVFYRGAGDIIGANRLDEKILEEIRRQEEDDVEMTVPEIEEEVEEESTNNEEQWASNGLGQQTLGV